VSVERMPRQNKKQIWCALNWRNGDGNGNSDHHGDGEVRLVQRPRTVSLMPGMWELPQSSRPPRSARARAHWHTFRHSITVTDYTVHVVRDTALRSRTRADARPVPKAKWIKIDRIAHLPITGLTRKILKAGGII
jgi:hypothetical protein